MSNMYRVTFITPRLVRGDYGMRNVTDVGLVRMDSKPDKPDYYTMPLFDREARMASTWPQGTELDIEPENIRMEEWTNPTTGEINKTQKLFRKSIFVSKIPQTAISYNKNI